jgi:putative exosortase-associated protein (TIGR04073 family)
MHDLASWRPAIAMARRAGLALMVAAAMAVPSLASAEQYTPARKLGRGFAGMTCGVMELPGNIVQTSRERGPGWGLTLGVAQGLGMIVVRELVGVYEFVTAPIDAPSGYRPILHPEFPWEYFERSSPRRPALVGRR